MTDKEEKQQQLDPLTELAGRYEQLSAELTKQQKEMADLMAVNKQLMESNAKLVAATAAQKDAQQAQPARNEDPDRMARTQALAYDRMCAEFGIKKKE